MAEGSRIMKPVQQFRYIFWFLVALYVLSLIVYVAISFGPFVNSAMLIGWSAAAAICLYCAFVFRHNTFEVGAVLFFLYAAGLTAVLMLTSLFRLDEMVFSIYLNLVQFWFWTVLAIALVGFLLLFSKIILNTNYIILLFAIVFFLVGVVFTALAQAIHTDLIIFIADGLRFLGMASWAAYFIRTCAQMTKAEVENVHKRPSPTPEEELKEAL